MDNLPPLPGLLLVALLLFLNGVFVATEFAFVTARRTRIDRVTAEGSASAQRVLTALGNVDYCVAASQLGITMTWSRRRRATDMSCPPRSWSR